MAYSEEDIDNYRSLADALDSLKEKVGIEVIDFTAQPIPVELLNVLHGDVVAKLESFASANYNEGLFDKTLRTYNRQIKLIAVWLKVFHTRGAIRQYETEESIQGFLSSAFFNRANVYDELRMYNEAINDYRLSLEIGNPEPWNVMQNIAITYAKKSQFSEARKIFNKAIDIAPLNLKPKIRELLSRLNGK